MKNQGAQQLTEQPRLKVVSFERTCLACPASWEGYTENGGEIFIRYRWGQLRVDKDRETMFSAILGDAFDGYLEYHELKEVLSDVLELPEEEAYCNDWEANWGPIPP